MNYSKISRFLTLIVFFAHFSTPAQADSTDKGLAWLVDSATSVQPKDLEMGARYCATATLAGSAFLTSRSAFRVITQGKLEFSSISDIALAGAYLGATVGILYLINGNKQHVTQEHTKTRAAIDNATLQAAGIQFNNAWTYTLPTLYGTIADQLAVLRTTDHCFLPGSLEEHITEIGAATTQLTLLINQYTKLMARLCELRTNEPANGDAIEQVNNQVAALLAQKDASEQRILKIARDFHLTNDDQTVDTLSVGRVTTPLPKAPSVASLLSYCCPYKTYQWFMAKDAAPAECEQAVVIGDTAV